MISGTHVHLWLLLFTCKSGTRFEFVLIDYAKYFCKSSLVLAESAKFREGNINN